MPCYIYLVVDRIGSGTVVVRRETKYFCIVIDDSRILNIDKEKV
jgi:hypothetical protein